MALKRVLLFSAGMDSFILKKVHNISNEECLWVNMHTKENAIEEKFIDTYFPGVSKLNFPLHQLALPNYIIPYRNYHLAMLAANFANNIYFAFTAGDTTKDKDFVFKAQTEAVLNYFALSQDKVAVQGPFTIQLPFKTLSKSELVSAYIAHGYDALQLLEQSCSCYAGKNKPCGKCRSCLRKYVACTVNGISTNGYWENDPVFFLQDFLYESIQKNREIEIQDIKKCINIKLQ